MGRSGGARCIRRGTGQIAAVVDRPEGFRVIIAGSPDTAVIDIYLCSRVSKVAAEPVAAPDGGCASFCRVKLTECAAQMSLVFGHRQARMEAEYAAIRDGLRRLREAGPLPQVFGSQAHRFRLHPPLPEVEVAAFEARHRVSLPAEYRGFLTHVGNGGAGPYYGQFPLGTAGDSGVDPDPWAGGDWSGTWPSRSRTLGRGTS